MIKMFKFFFSRSILTEIIFRNIYWRFNLSKYFNFKISNNDNELYDFNKIIEKLESIGVKDGSILVIHSSYESLINCSLKPLEIINKLIKLIGEEGTLVMNSARVLKKNKDNNRLTYNIQKSKVWTGVLPHVMIKDKRSEISEFPFNPIVAIGKDAKRITSTVFNENNLESSCGPNSVIIYKLLNS